MARKHPSHEAIVGLTGGVEFGFRESRYLTIEAIPTHDGYKS